MEWREIVGVRPAAGSVLRKLYSRGGPLICLEQVTFVLYLHSCWMAGMNYGVYFGLQRGCWGGGPRCKWNPSSHEPPEAIVCKCVLLKEAKSPCQHGKPEWECARPQQEHWGQLERRERKHPGQSFTGAPSYNVAFLCISNEKSGCISLTVMVNTP